MLSLNYDIGEFIKALGNRDYYETVWIADKEATEVERMLMRPQMTISLPRKQMEKYSSDLRNLIGSIRYSAVPKNVYGAGWFELLNKRLQRIEKDLP